MTSDQAIPRRRLIPWLLAAVVVAALLYYLHGMFWLPAIESHQGDGEFTNISRRLGPFALPGYCIKMTEFDLGNAFQAEYRRTRLPNIGRKCGVYLAIHDPNARINLGGDNRHIVRRGDVRLDLFDSAGAVIVQVSGQPKEFIWYGFRDVHALYQMDRSFFYPKSAEAYTLRISYMPDSALVSLKGYVYLECGGHP